MKKRLIIFIISALLIISNLASCSSYSCDVCKDKDPDCEVCSPAPRPEPKYFRLSDEVNVICHYENMSPTLSEAVFLMTNACKSLTGQKLNAKGDWNYSESERYDFEILIGNTNRPESKELFETLSYYDYAYKIVSENCVVICGGSDESTLKAVHQFLSDSYGCVEGKGGENRDVKVGTTYRYTHDYPERSILLCGEDIASYTIVYSGNDSDVYSANTLRSEISKLSSVLLPIKSIDEFEGGDAIYIGIDDKGGHLYENFGENGYVVKYIRGEHNTIIIDSNQGVRSGELVYSFYEEKLRDIPEEGSYNIDLPEGERYFVTSAKEFNGLRLQDIETVALDYGVTYQKRIYKDSKGAPVIAYAIIADLTKVTVINATPNYSDKTANVRSTTLAAMQSAEAAGYTVIAGTNADFFAISSDCHPSGLCIKQGKLLHSSSSRRWFGITNDGTPIIAYDEIYFAKYQGEIAEAIGGSHIILKNGFYNELGEGTDFGSTRHPRTSVGITDDNKLIMLVVDGRRPSLSNGASLTDLAYIMASLGAKDALNLDGGGSSSFITHTDADGYVVRNNPSDGSLRRVYNSLVLVKKEAKN